MKKRNTPTKRKILNLFKESSTALSQGMIELKLDAAVDRVTIYRILNSFCEDGILHKAVAEDGKSYFALCDEKCFESNEHHHEHFHFKCMKCNRVECLDQQVTLTLPPGYISESMNCWVSGICARCAHLETRKIVANSNLL